MGEWGNSASPALGAANSASLDELTREICFESDVLGNLGRIEGAWDAVLGEGAAAAAMRHNVVEIIHPADIREFREALIDPRLTRRIAVVRTRLRHAGGGWSWIEWRLCRDANACVRGVGRDVSEEVRLEELVRSREELLLGSQRTARLGHYTFDIRGGVWTPSVALAELFGIDSSYECDFAGWVGLVHPLDREAMRRYVEDEVIGQKRPFDRVYRIERISDGATRWVHGRGTLAFSESGEPIHLFGVIQDVTDSKLGEQAVERDRALLARAEDIARGGSWRLDLRTGAVTWSEGMHTTFDVSHAQFSGTVDSLFVTVHPDDADELRRQTSQAIATMLPQPTDYRIVRPDGIRWIHGEAAPEIDSDGEIVALVGYCQDITQLVEFQHELIDSNARLEEMVYQVAEVMGKIVEIRDPYTQGHQEGVARIAELLAIEMGLPEPQVTGVKMASYVHDIGKLGIPTEILTKPGELSEFEFKLVMMHSEHGYEVLRQVEFPWPLAEVAHQHHERMDGSGYPSGLQGADIIIEARVVAVADVLEAMASHRPYRPSLGLKAAVAEIMSNTPQKYDSEVAAACQRLYESGRLEI